jgi:hypothetical protein
LATRLADGAQSLNEQLRPVLEEARNGWLPHIGVLVAYALGECARLEGQYDEAVEFLSSVDYARRGKMIAGAGLIIRDQHGRVPLVHTTCGAKVWELPGGGLEPGEFPPADP